MAVQEEISSLKKKRAAFFGQLTRVKNIFADEEKQFTLGDLETRLEILDTCFQKFDATQMDIEILDENENGADKRTSFEESYCSTKAVILNKIRMLKARGSIISVHESTSVDSPRTKVVRLPKLQLTKFSGKYTEWPEFYSMFATLVDKDENLTEIEKFQHLKSCLTDAAAKTIQSLETTPANYQKAVTLLKSRFDNKKLIFQAHIAELFKLSRISSPNVNGLRNLCDTFNAHLRALDTLGSKEDLANGILGHLFASKMDSESQCKWEEDSDCEGMPSINSIIKFTEMRCQRLENINAAVSVNPNNKKATGNLQAVKNHNLNRAMVASNSSCLFCDSNEHSIHSCQYFLDLTPEGRYSEIKRLSACPNCLKAGHKSQACSSRSCKQCSKKHNTLLHFNSASSYINSNQNSSSNQNSTSPNANAALLASDCTASVDTAQTNTGSRPDNFVFLATAAVVLKDRSGNAFRCKALLDSASQSNFITERLVHALGVKRRRTATSICGIANSSHPIKHEATISLQSSTNEFQISLDCLILPSITTLTMNNKVNIAEFKIPRNIHLADPEFYKSSKIDLLIGASLFFHMMSIGQIQLGQNLPTLQKTRLGWIVSGNFLRERQSSNRKLTACTSIQNEDESLNELLIKFWEIESHDGHIKILKDEDVYCEELFQNTHIRLPNGEISVKLPLRQSGKCLGNSFEQAKRRFLNMETKFHRDPQLKEMYTNFMQEYISLGHMEEIDSQIFTKPHYFLPHHGVFKADSTTTKLRVVFDGSAKTTNDQSLNDIMMVGPTLQADLFSTLIKFRLNKFALTADIAKMYRCVKVQSPDKDLQCIIWRSSKEKRLSIYRLNTVTYGTAAAAYLAIRSMRQAALYEAAQYPMGSKIVLDNFYVDDMLAGANTLNQLFQIKYEVSSVLQNCGFNLRKWCSNNETFVESLPEGEKSSFLNIDDQKVMKALGIIWEPTRDVFLFTPSSFVLNNVQKITKRSVLSIIARIFDPLGLITPIIIKYKFFMQSLFKGRVHWDESLTFELHAAWEQLFGELKSINEIRIPRLAVIPQSKIQLHGFSDASMKAMGACLYLRSEGEDGQCQVSLLCSKTRVAPLKTISVPRLELVAALMLVELIDKVIVSTTSININQIFAWTDSSIVLSWLHSCSSDWSIFVSNRITKIQNLSSKVHWRYVPTNSNPADLATRGVSPHNLNENSLWFSGPHFLASDEKNWPQNLHSSPNELPERKRPKLVLLVSKENGFMPNSKYINNFKALRNTFAFVNRFISNCKLKSTERKFGHLDVIELKNGRILILRLVQRSTFSHEIDNIQNVGKLMAKSNLSSLNPFISANGLLCVGGRLQNSNLPFEAKHPAILPKDHPVTFAIIDYFHTKNMHVGCTSLKTILNNEGFWPIGGRHTIRKVINKCVRCFKVKPVLENQLMGRLPTDRVQSWRAFLNSGIDYFGPFYIKSSIRNRQPTKTYAAIFICFATKAVHLELANDLSSASFLAVLQRFVARRGKPATLYSDNATNFIGANSELKELKQLFQNQCHNDMIVKMCLDDGIQWKFIPPRSPHFGGLWESSVKKAKHHIRRIAGCTPLLADQWHTLTCQIEAIINSRPLTPISDSPDSLDVLTPAHFLIGTSLLSTPTPNYTELNFNRLDGWQKVHCLKQHFWNRFYKEYLHSLQNRNKWCAPHNNLAVGSLVLVKEDNMPSLKWPLGRVCSVVRGPDSLVRVVEVRLQGGIVKRALTRICLLPIIDNDLLKAQTFNGGEYGK